MALSMLTDKSLVNTFTESQDGMYTIKDQISLSIFFIIAIIFVVSFLYWPLYLIEIWLLFYSLPVILVIRVSVFGYNIYRLTKLQK